MKKKIYIAGCGGMLGDAFYKIFSNDFEVRATDIDLTDDWVKFCDFRFLDDYRKDVKMFKPDYLFHLGAYTDLEFCEKHKRETYLTNTTSVENAVLIANELDIPILYISTAGIFDGLKNSYDDWDMPNPLGVYGRSKYMGERYVVEHAKRYLICRAGWMMGGGVRKDKKFIGKIMRQITEGAKQLFIVNDKFGTPTYTVDFARTVKTLLEQELWGLYNCVCAGNTNRIEVALELLKLTGMTHISITAVGSVFFKEEYFAVRPDSENLENVKLEIRGIREMRSWRESLREYIEREYIN